MRFTTLVVASLYTAIAVCYQDISSHSSLTFLKHNSSHGEIESWLEEILFLALMLSRNLNQRSTWN